MEGRVGRLAVVVAAAAGASVVALWTVSDGPHETVPEARPDSSVHGPEASQPSTSGLIPDASVLFTLAPGADGCRWETREPPEPNPSLLRTTERCPDDILWQGQPGRSDLIYEVAGSLIRIGASGTTETLALPEHVAARGRFVHFWLDAGSDRLRLGYLADIPCVESETVCTYDLGTRSIQSGMDADGWERFDVQEAGAVVPEGDPDWSLPPWGTPGVAVAFEQDADDGWTLVSAVPTRSEADETPGLSVLDIAEAPGTVSLSQLRETATCLGLRRSSTGCEEYEGTVPPSLFEHLGDEYYEVVSISANGGTWVFPVIYGDGPHAMPPVLLECGTGCDPVPLQLPVSGWAQLSLSVQGPYLLVAREYRMVDAAVFAPSSTEPILVLASASSSVWLPR